MIDMAAGLALSGKKVYVYAMAPFITMRCLEQTKCSLALMGLPVTIVSVGAGLGYADAGPTHYNTEDIACMRSIVGVDVLSPCDEITTRMMARMTITRPGLRVIRLERHALPPIYLSETEVGNEGYTELRRGTDVCLLSYGHMLHRVMQAATKSGVGVIDLFQVKPIDNSLLDVLSGYSKVITVEEQCLSGGFGSAVVEAMADAGLQKPVKRLGLPDRYFFENGGREYLLDRYGLAISDLGSAIDAFSSA
jgi:transketolase